MLFFVRIAGSKLVFADAETPAEAEKSFGDRLGIYPTRMMLIRGCEEVPMVKRNARWETLL